jgi:hypothetical protein
LLESLEVLAIKTARGDAPIEVFSGRFAIYGGPGTFRFQDRFTFTAGTPVPVSDRVAAALSIRSDFVVTEPTHHARGTGCC